MNTLAELIRPAVTNAILGASVESDREGRARVARQAADRAVRAVSESALVRHATNDEPWYRSRVTLGAILSGLSPLLGLVGIALSPENQDAIVALIVAVGGIVGPAVTLWGRWISRIPVGGQ